MEQPGPTCSLCGRSLDETGHLSGDPVTGDRLCPSCAEGWPADVFFPTSAIARLQTAATLVVDPDEAGDDPEPDPLDAQLEHFVRSVPVAAVARDRHHEVTLASVDLYDEGFLLRMTARYPVGGGAGPARGCSDDIAEVLKLVRITITDNRRKPYQWAICGASSGSDGAWSVDTVRCAPVPGPEVTAIRIEVTLPLSGGGVPGPFVFDVSLTASAPPPLPATEHRLQRLAEAPVPPFPRPLSAAVLAPDDVPLPDLAALRDVIPINQRATRRDMTLALLTLEDFAEGLRLRLIAARSTGAPPADHADHAETGRSAPGPPGGGGFERFLPTLHGGWLVLTDDRGNRYGLRQRSSLWQRSRAGIGDFREIVMESPDCLHPGAVGLRLCAPALIWHDPPLGVVGSGDEARYEYDMGPFIMVFPVQRSRRNRPR